MNKRCPACSANNHDSKGDHLFLLKDGETWGCFHKEYHSDGKNYLEGKGSKPCSLPGQRLTTGRETVEEILSYPYLKGEFRGIRGDIYQLYQARISFDEATGSPSTLYFPIHSKGKLIGFHCRNLKEKSFYNVGSIAGQDLDLFGIDHCAKTGKSIVVTEGHIDTLSVYQAVKDRYPKINPNIVSLNNGIGSLKDMVSSVQDLNAYDQVLLCFDMDQPGREGIAKASKLLGGGKIRVMELSEKDANDCLVKGKQAEIVNAIFNPKEYIPSDIVTLSDLYEGILTETPHGIPYPWRELDELTYGIFDKQIISIGAGPGTGKTIFINQLCSYLMKDYKEKVALFSLEETPVYTAKKLIGSLVKKRIHLPGVSVSPEEIQETFDKLKKYLYIYDTQGFLSWGDIKSNIRYLASLGVKYFIIDPLTAVTANSSASEANELLNSMMAELSSLVQSLSITVFLISHLNSPRAGKAHSEGGSVTGEQFTQSRSLFRWSHLVIGLERNLQSEEEEEKNTVTVRVIKNRLSGKTGTISLFYNTESGILEESNSHIPGM